MRAYTISEDFPGYERYDVIDFGSQLVPAKRLILDKRVDPRGGFYYTLLPVPNNKVLIFIIKTYMRMRKNKP